MQHFDNRELGRAISLAEHHHAAGHEFHEELWTSLPTSTQIIGLTGPPGAGKSTLVNQLISCARRLDLAVGVVAIDPSSPFSGGALLGDRLRMSRHTRDPGVFIRSMGSRNNSGGLTAAARSAVRILTSHGADVILLETVGVGQTELEIMDVADTVVVTVVPGLGDAIQMNKAGVFEIADILVVNQSDKPEIHRTMKQLSEAMSIGGPKSRSTPIIATCALDGAGVSLVWDKLRALYFAQLGDGTLGVRRLKGHRAELMERVRRRIEAQLLKWLSSGTMDDLLNSAPPSGWDVHHLAGAATASFVTQLSAKLETAAHRPESTP